MRVKPGGIVDDAVMAEEDLVNQGGRVIDSLRSQGLAPGDAAIFCLPFLYRGEAMKKDLAFLQDFTQKLERAFPRYKVFSLANMPRFRDVEDSYLETQSYVSPEVLADFDPGDWKREVLRDPKVAGVFIAPDFSSANVILTFPRGYDEMQVGREIMEFLMDRECAWYEWYLIDDIKLASQFLRNFDSEVPESLQRDQDRHRTEDGSIKSVLPGGWVIGRVLMTGAFYSSLIWILSGSIILAALVFWLSFANLRQTAIALVCLLLALIWTRGSIGLLQTLGFSIQGKMLYETVYFVLVFTSLIVSGISFVERVFDAYNEKRKGNPELSRAEVWKKTKAKDIELIDERILMTGLVAIFGFATLYQIEIRQILEIGFFSALGLVFLLLFTLYLVPAVHILVGGEHSRQENSIPDKWWRILDWLVRKSFQLATPKNREFRKKGWSAVAVVAVLFLLMSSLVASDHVGPSKGFSFVDIKTEPLEFIKDTLVYEASEEINRKDNYGFDRAMFVIQSKKEGDTPAVYRPEFLREVDSFQETIAEDPYLKGKIRYIYSVLDILEILCRENYGHHLPQTQAEAADSLRLIRSEIGITGQRQLWSREALIVQVSVSSTNSNIQEFVLNRVLEISGESFPDLKVHTFGKVAMYARSDKYLRERKPVNAGMQIFWIFGFTFAWIAWRNRRFRKSLKDDFYLSSFRAGLAICLPFVFASTMIAFIMMAMRIPLNQATACITALTVNAAIDFSLYIVADYQAALIKGGGYLEAIKYAVLTRGRVVVIDVAINTACFAPLMISPFAPIADIGWIMMTMLIFCGFGAMVLLPMVLPLAVKENN
ncbi:MAG TPA: MMPL family transporter [Patescibacteria group bacterium]|nr:MMPL family transporter [Patescibacteria group bacterium]